MSAGKRFLSGALGALVPLLVALVTVEASQLFVDFDGLQLLGWAIRVVGLMMLGGLAAWQFSDETVQARVAFQLGMTWPAVLTAGGIGLHADASAERASDLATTITSVEAELDTLQVPDSLSAGVMDHIQHLDSIVRVEPGPPETSTRRVLDGLLGRSQLSPIRREE